MSYRRLLLVVVLLYINERTNYSSVWPIIIPLTVNEYYFSEKSNSQRLNDPSNITAELT